MKKGRIKIQIKKPFKPFQGPCCTNDCFFKNGDMCRDDNGCRGESFCNGRGPQCPNSDLKPNKTVCHQEFVCYKGVSLIFNIKLHQLIHF